MARTLRSQSSLRLKEESLRRESALLQRIRLIELGVTIVCLGGGLLLWLLRGSAGLLWLGAAALFLTIGHRLRQKESDYEAQSLEIGGSGETKMAERLEQALSDDTVIINDIMIAQGKQTAQIDHLVLAPNGAFVVETKNWSGRLSGKVSDPSWAVDFDRGKPRQFRNPVRQNRRQARFLRDYLYALDLGDREVVAVVSFASSRCKLEIEGIETANVFSIDKAVSFIKNYPSDKGFEGEALEKVLQSLGV